MGLWRIWHPRYGVIYDEAKVIKRGTYASSGQRWMYVDDRGKPSAHTMA